MSKQCQIPHQFQYLCHHHGEQRQNHQLWVGKDNIPTHHLVDHHLWIDPHLFYPIQTDEI